MTLQTQDSPISNIKNLEDNLANAKKVQNFNQCVIRGHHHRKHNIFSLATELFFSRLYMIYF